MKILLYRGRSLISRLIQFQTRSPYSHVAIMFDSGAVYEAWHVGGVRRLKDPFDGHSPGTYIDIYGSNKLDCADTNSALVFLHKQLGKGYDFVSVARFLSRRQAPANDKWFCSELVLETLAQVGIVLLHIAPSLASPRDIGISPRIDYQKTISNSGIIS